MAKAFLRQMCDCADKSHLLLKLLKHLGVTKVTFANLKEKQARKCIYCRVMCSADAHFDFFAKAFVRQTRDFVVMQGQRIILPSDVKTFNGLT